MQRCLPRRWQSPGALAASVGTQTASADGLQLVDFADRLVQPEQIKSAGFGGALVYVSELRPGATFDFKPVTRDYADRLRSAGLQVVSCYQFGKPGWPTPSDFTRGYDGGVADAQTALSLHTAAGGRRRRRSSSASTRTSMPRRGKVWQSNGFGESTRCWELAAPESAGAVANAVGPSPTVSSGHRPVRVTGGRGRPRHGRGGAGTGRRTVPEEVVTASDPGFVIDGIHVDVNDVLAADYGQWDLAR